MSGLHRSKHVQDGQSTSVIKNSRMEQSELTDHLHNGMHHNQSFEQKLGNLRLVLID